MNTGLKIACVGEAMIEIVADDVPGNAQLKVAGDVLNTAIYLQRAIRGAHSVHFVTVLGNDNLSNQMIEFMKSEGVKTNHVERDDTRLPGLYAISTDASGERTFAYWRENSAARQLFQPQNKCSLDSLELYDVLFTSAITLAILPSEMRSQFLNWIADFRQGGGLFAFDSNYRRNLWEDQKVAREVINRAWSLCDIALPSLDDELALFDEKSGSGCSSKICHLSCINRCFEAR